MFSKRRPKPLCGGWESTRWEGCFNLKTKEKKKHTFSREENEEANKSGSPEMKSESGFQRCSLSSQHLNFSRSIFWSPRHLKEPERRSHLIGYIRSSLWQPKRLVVIETSLTASRLKSSCLRIAFSYKNKTGRIK